MPPPRGVTANSKRARQYEHIKDSQLDQGRSEDRAEEIAARTVNKERARSGESRASSRTSTDDISSGRCGGRRSGTDRTKGEPAISSMPRPRSSMSRGDRR